jgi:RCR-type E3 ubiquitin transferase
LYPEGEDLCRVCWTEELREAPAVQLACGHTFHVECVSRLISNRWHGARVTFSFLQCPLCRQDIAAAPLQELLAPMMALRDTVREKALQRLAHEGKDNDEAVTSAGGSWVGDRQGYAAHIYAYYQCYKCEQPYFGGNYECAAQAQTEFDPAELVCPGCSIPPGTSVCPRHGKEYLEFKCRYCCTVAIWYCFGTTHFCETCHNNLQVQQIPKGDLPVCPAGPAGKQLCGECPLKLSPEDHPPTGDEFALGCSICRRAQGF